METNDRIALTKLGPGAPDAGKFRLDVNHGRVVIGVEGLVDLLGMLPREVWAAQRSRAVDSESGKKEPEPIR